MKASKTIVFIPPNARFKKQDFSLIRISTYLNRVSHIKSILVYIDDENILEERLSFDIVYKVKNNKELFKLLESLDYDFIFHRSWMHSYSFAAKLVKTSKNTIINIKDWNFANKNTYKFLFNNKDYKGISYIFKNAKLILSHFTKEQSKKWIEEYKLKENKFIFFPELCNEENFIERKNIIYKGAACRLVIAGNISPSSYPEDYFPGKSHIRSIKELSKNNIEINYVLPQSLYDNVMNNKNLYYDYIFEEFSNSNFNLIRGEVLNANILKPYHFGFFELETSGINQELYQYAIVSKFAFYLEAQLPILINSNFKSISKLVKKHNLGIIFKNKDLPNLDKILKKVSQKEYNNFLKSIKNFRKDFTYRKMDNILY